MKPQLIFVLAMLSPVCGFAQTRLDMAATQNLPAAPMPQHISQQMAPGAPFGTRRHYRAFSPRNERRAPVSPSLRTERNMPVIFLWGIPALIVIGGGAYWVAHLH